MRRDEFAIIDKYVEEVTKDVFGKVRKDIENKRDYYLEMYNILNEDSDYWLAEGLNYAIEIIDKYTKK